MNATTSHQTVYRLTICYGTGCPPEDLELATSIMRRSPDMPIRFLHKATQSPIGYIWNIQDPQMALEKLTIFKQCGLRVSLK